MFLLSARQHVQTHAHHPPPCPPRTGIVETGAERREHNAVADAAADTLGDDAETVADEAEELLGNVEDGHSAEDVQLADLKREADVNVASCGSGASVEEQGGEATYATPTVCAAQHDSARGDVPMTKKAGCKGFNSRFLLRDG